MKYFKDYNCDDYRIKKGAENKTRDVFLQQIRLNKYEVEATAIY